MPLKSGSFTSPAETRPVVTRLRWGLDIQVRKAHPPTSLNGWVGCQNEAVCESSCQPDNLGFPRMQAVSVETQHRPHPIRRQINAGPHQQVLRGPQQKWHNRRGAHDREKLKHNLRGQASRP
jgi:hypothetical protein